MAEIGYGYGSEYQMMRFLGHHKKELEKIIKNSTPLDGKFEWLDFPYNSNRLSLDGEYVGINFLGNEKKFDEIEKKWKEFWPQRGNKQNWDAILMNNGKIILIEAKAHIKEIMQSCGAKGESRQQIREAFEATKYYFKMTSDSDWLKHYYQLANRLAFVYFLFTCGISARILNVYFLNGYKIRKKINGRIKVQENKSVRSIKEWEETIKQEYNYLGINNSSAEKYVYSIYVDCTQ